MRPDRDRPRSRSAGARSGVVLIIVTGLAMVLLGIAVSFMLRMRTDSQETRGIVAEAQARLMLHAAMMYLQETSRLGWGEEGFGWTDGRDGSLGPRPPRDPVTGTVAQPSWWKGAWGAYAASPADAALTGLSDRSWPLPGSVVRCPMAVPVQPPYATQLRSAYNPVNPPRAAPAYGTAGWETAWTTATWADPITGLTTARYWPKTWADEIFDADTGAMAMLDPQPQASVWSDPTYTGATGQTPDFVTGAMQQGVSGGDWTHLANDGSTTREVQLQVRSGTDNVCWFRIYRELQGDHDGNGDPAYDRVVMYDPLYPSLKNWNVFIIACGTGPTRGYRFWDQADLDAWRAANGLAASAVTTGQEFASASPVFAGLTLADFRALRAASTVMWFRVEWSPLQGGGFVPERYWWGGLRIYDRTATGGWSMRYPSFPGYTPSQAQILAESNTDLLLDQREGGYADGVRYNAPKTYGGNFRWVQRLDHEPPNW